MMKKNHFIIFGILAIFFFQCSENEEKDLIKKNIILGNFESAQSLLLDVIISQQDTLSKHLLDSLQFEIERLDRIKQEFSLDSNEVLAKIRRYLPGANNSDLEKWIDQNYLESKIIEGEVKYFKRAVDNLFLVHPDLKVIKAKADSALINPKKIRKYVSFPLNLHINRVLKEYNKTKKKYILPVTINLIHTLDLNPLDSNFIVQDDPLKCWLPFPREIPNQQYNVKRITSEPHIHLISDNDNMQRTIFLQKLAKLDTATHFMVKYQFTSRAVYNNIDPKKIKPNENKDVLKYIKEKPPHIVFNEAVKELSKFILGDETNPFLKAKKFFIWIDKNVEWVKVREYSTIRSLGLYPFYFQQGDAGIKTFLFMTLCRYNQIPARLISGVQFQPPLKSLHDWCEIYLEPYGWVPVDVTYGIQDFPDDKRKYFYLGNIDSYRLVFNQGYGKQFTPPKQFFRSDMIDSQRGEIETMEKNLYFDKWKWNMEFKIVSTYK